MTRRERSDLISQLRRDARSIAGQFQLQYRGIVAEHPRVKARYGACYEDGLIKIRLNHAKTGKPLKYSSLIDTLCHELAHLRHFNHGPEFKDFFLRLLRWARTEGIYQPGPPSTAHMVSGERRESIPRDYQPYTQTLLHRNGIPVFPPLEPLEGTRALPWEKGLENSHPVIASKAAEPQQSRPGRAPEQLTLF